MDNRRTTHLILIGGTWHEAELAQRVNRRRGLPYWSYFIPALGREVKGKRMERLEAAGHVRKAQPEDQPSATPASALPSS